MSVVAGDSSRCRHDVRHLRGRPVTERCGERVGAQIHREPFALFGVQIGQQRQQGLGGGGVIGASLQLYRNQVEKHRVEEPSEVGWGHTVGSDTQHQRADAFGQAEQHRTVGLGGATRGGRKGLGDLPPGLDVAQGVATAHVRPLPGQRRLGQLVEAGVEGTDRETVVRRRIEQPVGFGGQVGGIFAGTLCQHPGYRGAPLLQTGLDSTGPLHRHRHSPVVAACD